MRSTATKPNETCQCLLGFAALSANLRLTAGPVGWQQALGDMAVNGGEGPVRGTLGVAMLDRIEVDVIDVPLQVVLTADAVLPVTSLPDAPLALEVA